MGSCGLSIRDTYGSASVSTTRDQGRAEMIAFSTHHATSLLQGFALASGRGPGSMDLMLVTVTLCGDNNRPRRQRDFDGGAVLDRVHAWSDHRKQGCATREAEKGKAGQAVSNAVLPVNPRIGSENMAA
jgi:hypothetical protein